MSEKPRRSLLEVLAQLEPIEGDFPEIADLPLDEITLPEIVDRPLDDVDL